MIYIITCLQCVLFLVLLLLSGIIGGACGTIIGTIGGIILAFNKLRILLPFNKNSNNNIDYI